jgi:hypothetical protein
MSKQYNKAEKRTRRARYLKRKKKRSKGAAKPALAKTAAATPGPATAAA